MQLRNAISAPAADGIPSEQHAAVMIVRLPTGPLALKTSRSEKTSISQVTMSLLDDNSEQARQFLAFAKAPAGARRASGSASRLWQYSESRRPAAVGEFGGTSGVHFHRCHQ